MWGLWGLWVRIQTWPSFHLPTVSSLYGASLLVVFSRSTYFVFSLELHPTPSHMSPVVRANYIPEFCCILTSGYILLLPAPHPTSTVPVLPCAHAFLLPPRRIRRIFPSDSPVDRVCPPILSSFIMSPSRRANCFNFTGPWWTGSSFLPQVALHGRVKRL